MKKINFAAVSLIGILSVSVAAQTKSGITANNHPSGKKTGVQESRSQARARLAEPKATGGTEEIATALLSEFKAKASAETPKVTGSNSPTSDKATVNSPVESERVANSKPASDVAAPTLTSAPMPVVPTEIYRVGIGDVLDVQLPQTPVNRSTLFTVLEGGVLDYPFLTNPVRVAGLTAPEIAARLRQEIKLFDKPDVVVTVRDYASHNVTVTGWVNAPGIKLLRREAVPLYVVITQSLPLAEAARATIIRTGTEPITLDLSDSKAASTLVIPGDVIKVLAKPATPPEFFFAGGELAAPGQKPYHEGLTLTQAILASGGLTKNAGARVQILRQAADGHLVKTEYNLRNIQKGKAPDPVMQKGDRMEINAQ